jgi:hypothetical protein
MDNSVEAQSPPPAQLDEAPQQLPSLPTEILQRIIQLALPRLSFSFKTFRERYDILLNLCRVNKLWAALAQRELVKHVGFSTIADMKQFQSAQTARVEGQGVNRSLWLGRCSSSSLSVGEMLEAASGLTALYYLSKLTPLDVCLLKLVTAAPGERRASLPHCAPR